MHGGSLGSQDSLKAFTMPQARWFKPQIPLMLSGWGVVRPSIAATHCPNPNSDIFNSNNETRKAVFL